MKENNAPFRWWDLPAIFLLTVAVITAATRLVATNWTDQLSLIQNVAMFGLLAGLFLGKSRFSPRTVFYFALAYGLFTVPWQLGRPLGPGVLWQERLLSLAGRLEVIIGQLLKQQPVQDSLLFLVLMAALFWALSVHASYTLVRHGNAWQALLPSGLALFMIHSFDPLIIRRAWYLAIYIFFGLVLVARVTYLHRYSLWRQSRTTLPPHLGLDFIRYALTATAIIVIFAWTVPALAEGVPVAEKAWQQVKQPWNAFRDRFDNAFASLRSTVGVVSDYYGSSAVLGRGNLLSDRHVLTVTPPRDIRVGARYYWRGRAYDRYQNGQWLSTNIVTQDFNPQRDSLDPMEVEGRLLGTFNILVAAPVSTFFGPPQPLWVSRPGRVVASHNSDGSLDLSAFQANPVLSPGEVYQVEASISVATIAQMKAAGEDYPDWVKERYLQLPDTITERTIELAHTITDGLETPYDKAQAITDYLRSNILYSETVPNQPPRQEPIDWFLFDLKKGFCNYYASAEVVMLRAVGIPARWAVGYARGERMDDSSYIVRQQDAHAWPEVFFPNLGWVEFEPTASQPVIVRLPGDGTGEAGSGDTPGTSAEDLNAQMLEEMRLLREEMRNQEQPEGSALANTQQPNPWINLAAGLGAALIIAVLAVLAWRNRQRYNFAIIPVKMERAMLKIGVQPPKILRLWAQRAGLPPLSRAYLEVNSALGRLGNRPAPDATPTERVAVLSDVLPPVREPAQRLVNEYQIGLFSPYDADLSNAQAASSEIRWESYKAFFQRLFSRLQKPNQDRTAWWQRNGRG